MEIFKAEIEQNRIAKEEERKESENRKIKARTGRRPTEFTANRKGHQYLILVYIKVLNRAGTWIGLWIDLKKL